MSDSAVALRAVLGKGSVYTVGTALRLAGALLVLPLLTRVLSPEEYGVVATAIIVQTLLALVASAGLPAAMVRSYFKDDLGASAARSLVGLTAVIAAMVALVAELTGPLWSQIFADVPYAGALRLATWTAVAIATLDAIQSLLTSQERPGAFVVVIGAMTLGAQALGVAVGAITEDAEGYLLGFAIGNALALFLGLRVARVGKAGFPRRDVLGSALRVGLPVVPHSLALYVMAAGDRVVIENLEGLDAVGRFHLAYVIGSLGLFVIAGINQAWSPIIFKAAEEDRWRLLADTMAAMVLMAALLGGAIAIASAPVLSFLAPSEYRLAELAPVSALVAGAVVPVTAYMAASHALFWLGRTTPLALITPICAVLNIGLCLLLIPEFGLVGAAVATLGAYVVQAAMIGWISRRRAPVPWRDGRTLFSALVCVVLVAIAILQPEGGVWSGVRIVESVGLLALAGRIGIRGTSATAGSLRLTDHARTTTK